MFLGMRVFIKGFAKVIIMEREDWMIFIKYVANGVLHCNSCSFAFCLIYRKESIIPRLVAMKLPPPQTWAKRKLKEGQNYRYTLDVNLLQ